MAELEPYSGFVRLLPSVFLLWLAWVVGRGPRRDRSNRLLSSFFFIVAAGFFLEFLARILSPASPNSFLIALANVIGAIDPPFLLAFSLALARSPLLRSRALWVAYGIAAVVFAFVMVPPNFTAWAHLPTWVPRWAPFLYVNGTYLVSFAILLHAYLYEQYRFRRRQIFFVVVAVGFAVLSRTGALFFENLRAPVADVASAFVLPGLIATLLVTTLLWAGTYALAGRIARRSDGVFLVLLVALVLFAVCYYAVIKLDGALGFSGLLSNQFYGLRWLPVGAILGYGVLRYQLFDFELRSRQAVAFVISMCVGLVAAFAFAPWWHGRGETEGEARIVGLGLGLAAAIAAWPLLLRLWKNLRGPADLPANYRSRRLELYEAALEVALGEREWTLAERMFADTLRTVFEISDEEHEQVKRTVLRTAPAENGFLSSWD